MTESNTTSDISVLLPRGGNDAYISPKRWCIRRDKSGFTGRFHFVIALIKELINGPGRMVLFGRNGNVIKVRWRTNWLLIFWDYLRLSSHRRQYLLNLRKMFKKIVSKWR